MAINNLRIRRGDNRPPGPIDIDPQSFPDPPHRRDGVPCTVANVRHMLDANGIVVRYDVIKKRTEFEVPWLSGIGENADSVSMTHIQSMASRYNMPTGLVPAITEAIGEEKAFNPARDWILSEPWDGIDRRPAICATLTPRDGYPLALRDTLVVKWLLSVTAAAVMPSGFHSRGVLTLQGPQSMGKTSWGLSLIEDPALRSKMIKVDLHLDAANKDSQLGAIDHWIVEIGELESSFRRDVSRLKGFLTSGTDKIRRPYGRVTVEYQRRTVFYATVNSSDFLVDSTGNSRWWTIPCERIDYGHGINTQQLFAQLATELDAGATWWLAAEEERQLEAQNSNHHSVSVVRDRLAAIVNLDFKDLAAAKAMTASEALLLADFDRPTNSQAKECAALLREWFGESKRINGRDKWRVPLRPGVRLTDAVTDDEDDKPSPKSKFD